MLNIYIYLSKEDALIVVVEHKEQKGEVTELMGKKRQEDSTSFKRRVRPKKKFSL